MQRTPTHPGADSGAGRTLLAVDIGGSFTDVVLMAGADVFTTKVLTTPQAPEEGVMTGIGEILGMAGRAMGDISLFILGTTLATNALIERKGARTALIATEGFRDVVEIGQENRFAQYDIFLEKPAPLVPRHLRFGIPERIDVHGRVLRELDEEAVVALAGQLRAAGVESVAVAFLHSYVNPAHERRVAELLGLHAPDIWVTLSSTVCPEVREYERTSTACANAYVQPVVAGYLGRLDGLIRAAGMQCPVYLMTSGGAIATVEMGAEQPVKLVESGPAGGAILARQIAEQCAEPRALSFDMGGTTAKICFIDDYEPELSRSFEFGRMYRFMKGSGLPIRIPVIEMVEIGAGGGSIARVDEMGRVQVGPDSATSNPGPACFGRGGTQPTVTDANCAMGMLDPARFAAGKIALRPDAAAEAIARDVAGPLGMDAAQGAAAISEIVAENMANAARVHGIELGKPIERYTMIAFGGAAPLHAGQLAAKLGVDRVIVPVSASVGSALGFLWAPVAYQALRSHHQRLSRLDVATVNQVLDAMEEEAAGAVRRAAPEGARIGARRVAYMRYAGQGHEIAVALPEDSLRDGAAQVAALRERFEAQYRKLYGRVIPGQDVEVMTWTVTASTETGAAGRADLPEGPAAEAGARRPVFLPQTMANADVAIVERESLRPGHRIAGPALIVEAQTTTVVPPDFVARVNSMGYLVLDREGRGEQQ